MTELPAHGCTLPESLINLLPCDRHKTRPTRAADIVIRSISSIILSLLLIFYAFYVNHLEPDMKFVDRRMELGLLDDVYQREGPQFLIVYGRRRIGKTRLLTHWLEAREEKHFFWVATQTSAVNQLRHFSKTSSNSSIPGPASSPLSAMPPGKRLLKKSSGLLARSGSSSSWMNSPTCSSPTQKCPASFNTFGITTSKRTQTSF